MERAQNESFALPLISDTFAKASCLRNPSEPQVLVQNGVILLAIDVCEILHKIVNTKPFSTVLGTQTTHTKYYLLQDCASVSMGSAMFLRLHFW